jgi:integrase
MTTKYSSGVFIASASWPHCRWRGREPRCSAGRSRRGWPSRERRLFYGETWTDYDVVLDDVAGAPFAPWSVSADFRRITRELELPRTRFHDLRHAHATQLLGAGVHPKAVSERLGHSTVAFTMDVYSAVIPSMGRAAADTADQLFGEERGR